MNDFFVIWPMPVVLSHFVNSQIMGICDKVKKKCIPSIYIATLSNSCISKHTNMVLR